MMCFIVLLYRCYCGTKPLLPWSVVKAVSSFSPEFMNLGEKSYACVTFQNVSFRSIVKAISSVLDQNHPFWRQKLRRHNFSEREFREYSQSNIYRSQPNSFILKTSYADTTSRSVLQGAQSKHILCCRSKPYICDKSYADETPRNVDFR